MTRRATPKGMCHESNIAATKIQHAYRRHLSWKAMNPEPWVFDEDYDEASALKGPTPPPKDIYDTAFPGEESLLTVELFEKVAAMKKKRDVEPSEAPVPAPFEWTPPSMFRWAVGKGGTVDELPEGKGLTEKLFVESEGKGLTEKPRLATNITDESRDVEPSEAPVPAPFEWTPPSMFRWAVGKGGTVDELPEGKGLTEKMFVESEGKGLTEKPRSATNITDESLSYSKEVYQAQIQQKDDMIAKLQDQVKALLTAEAEGKKRAKEEAAAAAAAKAAEAESSVDSSENGNSRPVLLPRLDEDKTTHATPKDKKEDKNEDENEEGSTTNANSRSVEAAPVQATTSPASEATTKESTTNTLEARKPNINITGQKRKRQPLPLPLNRNKQTSKTSKLNPRDKIERGRSSRSIPTSYQNFICEYCGKVRQPENIEVHNRYCKKYQAHIKAQKAMGELRKQGSSREGEETTKESTTNADSRSVEAAKAESPVAANHVCKRWERIGDIYVCIVCSKPLVDDDKDEDETSFPTDDLEEDSSSDINVVPDLEEDSRSDEGESDSEEDSRSDEGEFDPTGMTGFARRFLEILVQAKRDRNSGFHSTEATRWLNHFKKLPRGYKCRIKENIEDEAYDSLLREALAFRRVSWKEQIAAINIVDFSRPPNATQTEETIPKDDGEVSSPPNATQTEETIPKDDGEVSSPPNATQTEETIPRNDDDEETESEDEALYGFPEAKDSKPKAASKEDWITATDALFETVEDTSKITWKEFCRKLEEKLQSKLTKALRKTVKNHVMTLVNSAVENIRSPPLAVAAHAPGTSGARANKRKAASRVCEIQNMKYLEVVRELKRLDPNKMFTPERKDDKSYRDALLRCENLHPDQVTKKKTKRRKLSEPPETCKQVKDDLTTRKFTVCAEHTQELQDVTTWSHGKGDLNPIFLPFMMTYDEMIQRPDRVRKKGQDNTDYFSDTPRINFLCPKRDFDRKKFATVLERVATAMKTGETDSGDNWECTDEVEKFFEMSFGDKEFKPQGSNKQKKRK